MLQFLDLNPTDNVLSLATGFGYSCALLSSLVNFVVAVERHELAQEAQNRLIETQKLEAKLYKTPGTKLCTTFLTGDQTLVLLHRRNNS